MISTYEKIIKSTIYLIYGKLYEKIQFMIYLVSHIPQLLTNQKAEYLTAWAQCRLTSSQQSVVRTSKKALIVKVTIFSHYFRNDSLIYDCLRILNMQKVVFTNMIRDHSICNHVLYQMIAKMKNMCFTMKPILHITRFVLLIS